MCGTRFSFHPQTQGDPQTCLWCIWFEKMGDIRGLYFWTLDSGARPVESTQAAQEEERKASAVWGGGQRRGLHNCHACGRQTGTPRACSGQWAGVEAWLA